MQVRGHSRGGPLTRFSPVDEALFEQAFPYQQNFL